MIYLVQQFDRERDAVRAAAEYAKRRLEEKCLVPCSDAAGTCTPDCPHLKEDA